MFPSDEELLKHIRDEASHILSFMRGKHIDDLRSDFMLERAVTPCLEIMGEASKKSALLISCSIPICPGGT